MGNSMATVAYTQENKKRHRFEITLVKEGTKIIIRTFKDLVSVAVDDSKAGADCFKNSVRLLGSHHGQMFARDGVTVLDADPNAFGLEWQVRDTEAKLFQNVKRYPQCPDLCVIPKELSAESGRRLGEENGISEEAANLACAKFHHPEADMDACVYDVMATGDLEVAEAGVF